ncbi:c-type cytochrome biogenesis protein CcsB [Georgenia faecalis]|uniref:C-type cytochrome biogenesis protein CcsB n=1 Tax=Georgenia faecalis TaxID=2483799 RepID=A0ABV9D756_9MICO|nr:c-type cytochrome biogenesis protein CcsB [Georgenia faecalis]
MNDTGQLSLLAIYGAMAAYAVAMVGFGIDLSGLRDGGAQGRRRRAVGVAMATTALGAALHLVGVVLRGVAAGRVPWANMYEFSLVFTLVAVLVFLGLQLGRDLRFLGAFVVTPVLLTLGLAVAVLYVAADGVQPALNHYWLVIHVSVATIAVGVLAIAAVLSVVQLAKERSELARASEAGVLSTVGGGPAEPVLRDEPREGGRSFWGRLADTVPGSVELERLAYRLNAVGFLLWSFTLVAGAIWAEHAWGRAWGWDPKEVWTFVIWVVYAAYLHARATRGWDGRKAAYFCLAGFGCILVNYFVVNLLIDGLHSYSGL